MKHTGFNRLLPIRLPFLQLQFACLAIFLTLLQLLCQQSDLIQTVLMAAISDCKVSSTFSARA